MKRRKEKLIVLMIALVLVIFGYDDVLVGTGASITSGTVAEQRTELRDAVVNVVRVVDGDTVVVSFDGLEKTVRLIGVNTPETVDPRRPVECFGKEASQKLTSLLPVGSTVTLYVDPSQGEVDRYGRLLRYVESEGGDVGQTLIREGYAQEYTYRTPYVRQTRYQEAEVDARTHKRGLWNDSVCPSEE